MFWRITSYLICQLAGGLSGWYLARVSAGHHEAVGALAGVVGVGLAWFIADLARGYRLLRWLKSNQVSDTAVAGGLWGEVGDRARRQFRLRDRAIQASDARLQDFLAALQASPNGVVLLDSEARIEWFNLTASTHFGFEVQRDLAQHFGNLVRDPGFAAYFAAQDFGRDVIMPGRESTLTRPVKLAVHLHPYGDGRLLVLSRDITALEQAEAMRRDFVANVSHEVRTPLTVLSGFVETLQTLKLNDEERQRYLGLMAQQSDRMQTLVSDLLTLSKLEGSPPVSSKDWVSVGALLQQVMDEARGLMMVLGNGQEPSPNPSHVVRVEIEDFADIAGSANELQSAVANLVGNAIRYTPRGGQIQIRAVLLSDGRYVLSVHDSGPGIAPEHLPRLTERFYRVDRSRSRDTGGTGLGLAIVKHVTQRHGAELKIASVVGEGSTFSMVFPATRVRSVPPVLVQIEPATAFASDAALAATKESAQPA